MTQIDTQHHELKVNSNGAAIDCREATLRRQIPNAKRILIKIGTSVIAHKNCTIALGRIARIVEEIVELKEHNKEVILVSSGAIGLGSKMIMSNHGVTRQYTSGLNGSSYYSVQKRASAAIGQARLMSLYDNLFAVRNVSCSQILLENRDFTQPGITSLAETCSYLLRLGVVPIFNGNDVTNLDENHDALPVHTDNDTIACTLAAHMGADLVILLTDVDGVFTAPPHFPGARIIPLLETGTKVITQTTEFGGGMEAKISAALKTRVPAIVIANGFSMDTITRAARGDPVGTLVNNGNLKANL